MAQFDFRPWLSSSYDFKAPTPEAGSRSPTPLPSEGNSLPLLRLGARMQLRAADRWMIWLASIAFLGGLVCAIYFANGTERRRAGSPAQAEYMYIESAIPVGPEEQLPANANGFSLAMLGSAAAAPKVNANGYALPQQSPSNPPSADPNQAYALEQLLPPGARVATREQRPGGSRPRQSAPKSAGIAPYGTLKGFPATSDPIPAHAGNAGGRQTATTALERVVKGSYEKTSTAKSAATRRRSIWTLFARKSSTATQSAPKSSPRRSPSPSVRAADAMLRDPKPASEVLAASPTTPNDSPR